MISSGRVRPLGVTSLTRVAGLASVPTIAEAGVPNFEFGLWYVILGPARMTSDVVNQLNNEIRKALMVSSVKANIEADGGQVLALNPQQTAEHMQKELRRYKELISAAGIQVTDR
jgi:tripartite-type tricarboxylate transporter receptor subunit TctC